MNIQTKGYLCAGAALAVLGAMVLTPALSAQSAAPRPTARAATPAAKAAAQPAAPETPIPEFAGAEFGWQAAGADFLQPESGPGPVKDEPGHEHVGNGQGGQPSFRRADTSNPILKPWVVEVLKRTNANVAAGGRGGFTPQVSCIPQGVPAFLLYPAQPVFFIQTPKQVLMTWQPDHMTRRIYMNVEHSANPKPSWFGESVGRYEGDELVVDTIGITEKTFVDNFRTPHTSKLHVIERFKIAPDGKSMDVDVTVEDPGAFNMPWKARQHYRKVEGGPMTESSCAESPNNLNYDIDPIPQTDKPDF
jgi:hypothetical protein